MTSIYVYQKHIDIIHSVVANLPEEGAGELATIGDNTYIFVEDGVALPEQPSEIHLEPVELNETLRTQISQASPHVRLINERIVEKIRTQYTENDELKFAHLGWQVAMGEVQDEVTLSELEDFNAFVEQARSWGRVEKEKLGLGDSNS